MEHRLRSADGHYEWFLSRAQPLRGVNGHITKWFGTCTGIDELKRAQEALQDSQERLSMAQRAAKAGTWEWDMVTGEVRLSEEYRALCQLEPEGPYSLGMWLASIYVEDRERIEKQLNDLLSDHESPRLEFRVCRNGSICWISLSSKTFCNVQGTPLRVIGIALDITSAKRAEADLLRLLEEAQRHERQLQEQQEQLLQSAKLASIGELASGIAHELNNPLNNISLFIGNVLERVEGCPKAADMTKIPLQMAQEQVKRAATIIDHLRTFARRAPSGQECVPVNGLLYTAVGFFQEQLRLAEIEVQLNLSKDDPCVRGNGLQLEQVLVNLLSNARDAMKDRARRVLHICSMVKCDEVILRVQDTGEGIPPGLIPSIFDPFFTTKPVGEGTGLGLAISYGIIKDHQGTIDVQSSTTGTAFVITFPLMKGEK
jgi:C4-dicarboxylate-specific signal transduction histidine kinase